MIDFTYLAKFIYVSIRVLKRFTMDDRKHTHNIEIYSKICASIEGCVNSSDTSLEDGRVIVTKAFPSISLVVLGHFYGFYGGRCLGSVRGFRRSFNEIYVLKIIP